MSAQQIGLKIRSSENYNKRTHKIVLKNSLVALDAKKYLKKNLNFKNNPIKKLPKNVKKIFNWKTNVHLKPKIEEDPYRKNVENDTFNETAWIFAFIMINFLT